MHLSDKYLFFNGHSDFLRQLHERVATDMMCIDSKNGAEQRYEQRYAS